MGIYWAQGPLTRCRKRILEEEKKGVKSFISDKRLWTRDRILAEMRVIEDCLSCCRGANEWKECGWNAGCRHSVLSISSGNLCVEAFVTGKDRVVMIYFHAYFPCHTAIPRHVTSYIFSYNDNPCSNVFCKPNKTPCVPYSFLITECCCYMILWIMKPCIHKVKIFYYSSIPFIDLLI